MGCLVDSLEEALIKSMISVGHRIPRHSVLISSGDAIQKADLLPACQLLRDKGYAIYATSGTFRYLQDNGVPAIRALWPTDPTPADAGDPAVLDLIARHEVELVVNIPKNFSTGELTNGYKLRRAAIDYNVPLITNSRLATAFIQAFCTLSAADLKIKAWDEYR